MKWIFLSPHLDDIAFSCGGLAWDLANAGHHIEIWTICAGDPPRDNLSVLAEELHRRWGLGLDAVQIRREEDQIACRILGAVPSYFPFLDCIYRKTPEKDFFYTGEEEIFAGLDPRESVLIDQLSQQLQDRIPVGARVVAPLGIGNHVDHELVRKAATRLKLPLSFYADYPYAREKHGREILDFMDYSCEWESEKLMISQEGLAKWIQAAGAYRSQISTFWDDSEHLGRQIREFSAILGGFRLWKAV